MEQKYTENSLYELGQKLSLSEVKSSLIQTCEQALSKPINRLSNEELRILMTQGIGLKFLVPLALDVLDEDPLTCCGLYSGDLLQCLFTIDGEFWSTYPELNNRLVEIKFEVEEILDTLKDQIAPLLKNFDYR